MLQPPATVEQPCTRHTVSQFGQDALVGGEGVDLPPSSASRAACGDGSGTSVAATPRPLSVRWLVLPWLTPMRTHRLIEACIDARLDPGRTSRPSSTTPAAR